MPSGNLLAYNLYTKDQGWVDLRLSGKKALLYNLYDIMSIWMTYTVHRQYTLFMSLFRINRSKSRN